MKKYVSMLALATLISCTSHDEVAPMTYSDEPIGLTSSSLSVDVVSSRAPYKGIISASNPLTAIVVTTASNTDFTQFYSTADLTYTMTWAIQHDFVPANNTANSVPHSTLLYYPANPTTPVYLSGLYPTTGWTSTGATTFQHAIDGATDIMRAPTVATYKTDASALPTTYKNLAFTHALTLLDIYVVAESTSSIATWGNLTDMTITKAANVQPNTSCTITFSGGTSAYTVPGNINTYTHDGSAYLGTTFQGAPLTTTLTQVAYSIPSPITAVSGSAIGGYSITVKTVNQPAGIEVPVILNWSGWTEGKAFTITLTFRTAEIRATATVTDWDYVGTGSGVVL